MAKRQCKAEKRTGGPCGAPPLVPGKMFGDYAASGDYCLTHDPDLPDEFRIGGATEGGGRKRVTRPHEVARRLVEENVVAVLRPYWRTLGFDVEIGDDGPELVKLHDGGAKVTAAYQGEVVASDVEDLGAQMAAAEKLLDRVYGRPMQATEISGPEGGPVQVVDVRGLTDDALRELAAAVGVADDDASSRPG